MDWQAFTGQELVPHSPDFGAYPPEQHPGNMPPARRGNLRFVDPDAFSNTVLHWLAQNPQANGKVMLRVYPCRVLGTKQRPRRTADRSKLLLQLPWYPQSDGGSGDDGDENEDWRVDEFLLASEAAQEGLDFGEPYAVSAYSPGPAPAEIARCYVELQSDEPEQRRSGGGRTVAGVEDSMEAQFSALIRKKVIDNMSEELGLAPTRRRPTSALVPENLVPIGEGQFIDPRRAHTVWQAERDDLRRKVEEMERKQKESEERRGFLNHPLIQQAVSGVLPLLTAFAGAKMMGGAAGGPSQGEVFQQLLTVGQPPPPQAEEDDDDEDDDEEEMPRHHWSRQQTVAGPPSYSPPPAAYQPPPARAPVSPVGSPPPAYHSPLAEDVPVVPTAGGADLHSVFGNDVGRGNSPTVSGFTPKAKVMPLEVRLKPVASAVLKTIEAVQARVNPFTQWAAYRVEVEKEALKVFLPAARKAGIGDAELRLLAEKPEELTRQFMAAISPEDRARLGGIILGYVQQIIREIVTNLDWDAYLSTE